MPQIICVDVEVLEAVQEVVHVHCSLSSLLLRRFALKTILAHHLKIVSLSQNVLFIRKLNLWNLRDLASLRLLSTCSPVVVKLISRGFSGRLRVLDLTLVAALGTGLIVGDHHFLSWAHLLVLGWGCKFAHLDPVERTVLIRVLREVGASDGFLTLFPVSEVLVAKVSCCVLVG
jgi:hypothetical protein